MAELITFDSILMLDGQFEEKLNRAIGQVEAPIADAARQAFALWREEMEYDPACELTPLQLKLAGHCQGSAALIDLVERLDEDGQVMLAEAVKLSDLGLIRVSTQSDFSRKIAQQKWKAQVNLSLFLGAVLMLITCLAALLHLWAYRYQDEYFRYPHLAEASSGEKMIQQAKLSALAINITIHHHLMAQYPEALDQVVQQHLALPEGIWYNEHPFAYQKTKNGFVLAASAL